MNPGRRALAVISVVMATWGASLAPAYALPVTDSSNGTIYSLTVPTVNGVPVVDGTVGPAGTFTYDITFTVDATGFFADNIKGTPVLDAVAFKISPPSLAAFGPSLDSVPVGTVTDFAVSFGGTSVSGGSAGCDTNVSNDFICAAAVSDTIAKLMPVGQAGSVYSFVFDVTLTAPLTSVGTGASIKAIYCDSDTKGAGCNQSLAFLSQTSIPGTLDGDTPPKQVPEPTTLVMLGGGLVLLAVGIRRRALGHAAGRGEGDIRQP